MSDRWKDPEDFRATLTEHLDDLRQRIVRIVLLVAGGWVAGWFLWPTVYAHLYEGAIKNLVLPEGVVITVAFNTLTDPFMLQLKLALYIGLIVTLPLSIHQLWGFVAPGLKKTERRPVAMMAPVSLGLFLLGAFFCWLIIPTTMQWFVGFTANFEGAAIRQDPALLIFFILKMMLGFGIGFQLPLIVYGLGALGLLSSETLMQYWRQATVFIFFISAVLTPSSDPISMLVMAIPLALLFMVSVYAVNMVQGKKRRVASDVDDDL